MQLIIVNLETKTQWLYPVDEMWPIIPRVGEYLLYTVENENGQEDAESSFDGIVEKIEWSTGNYDSFSIFIYVRPEKSA